MEELKSLLDMANVISYFGGDSRSLIKRIDILVKRMEYEKGFEEAMGYAKLLCKLGYGILIEPNNDGHWLIYAGQGVINQWKGVKIMDLIETLKLDGEKILHKPVQEHLEKECSEEVKFVDGLTEDQWTKVYSLVASSIEKAFEIGFALGQQRRA